MSRRYSMDIKIYIKKRPVHRVIRWQALIIWGKSLYGLTATNCCLAAVISAVFSADLAEDLALKA
jgi:hypothetical protein